MSSDKRIDELLKQWLDSGRKLTPEQLAAGDAAILSALRSAMAARSSESPPLGPASRPSDSPTIDSNIPDSPTHPKSDKPEELPQSVGRYRVLSQLGQGGMGVVYKAEQRDPIIRIVAIKLIKLGMDTKEVLARFEAERQALAMMDHPNIARVLDAGATDVGRPYFVMEFVAGEPITAYCDKHNLTTRQRLELFVQICEAIQHAHSKGLIHRDLKPANVLVTVRDGLPIPKIIDFGVAKATAQRLTEKTLFTELGQFIGTPEYMSPEQAEMTELDIDTRSDVYSLGVMLYELLTGALPFDTKTLRRAAYAEIQRIIREVEPPRPSTRLSGLGIEGTKIAQHRHTDVPELTAELKRELEWIPLKAMRKDRTMRYRTAIEMADDIRNYLSGKPLSAGPESASYRISKFVRRNRKMVGAVSAMLLIVVTTTAVAFVMITRSRNRAIEARNEEIRQRRLAEENYQIARQAVDRFLSRVMQEKLLNQPGMRPLRNSLLQDALGYYDRFLAQRSADNLLQSDVASALYKKGYISAEIQSAAAAIDAYEKSLKLRRDNVGSLDERIELGLVLNNLGSMRSAIGQTDIAMSMYTEALAISRKAAADPTNSPAAKELLGRTLNNLGVHHTSTGRYDDAIAALNEAIAIRTSILSGGNPDDETAASDLAASQSNLGLALARKGDLRGAVAAHQSAAAIFQRLSERRPNVESYRNDLASACGNAGGALRALGKSDEALTLYRKAADTRSKLLADNPEVTPYLIKLANAELGLAAAYYDAHKPDEESKALEAAAEHWRKAVKQDQDNLEARRGLADAATSLADLAFRTGRAAAASPLLAEAISQNQAIANNAEAAGRAPEHAGSLNSICWLQMLDGKLDDATKSAEKGLAIKGAAAEVRAALQLNLAHTLLLSGQFDRAEKAYAAARTLDGRSASEFLVSVETDFATLKSAGRSHPDMPRISAFLKP